MNRDQLNEIKQIEKSTLSSLKDFQLATVNRINELFQTGHKRVLVADEVGLGKTMVARGVIAKTVSRLADSKNFIRIIYVCSNLSIGEQNIRKLNIYPYSTNEDLSDNRLSMQHLKIMQNRMELKRNNRYVQLIPLTPGTSIHMTTGRGIARERALIYVILRRMPELKAYGKPGDVLYQFLSFNVKGWEGTVSYYEGEVKKCLRFSNNYVNALHEEIRNYRNSEGTDVLQELKSACHVLRLHPEQRDNANSMINKLRIMFATISVQHLEPDLVIMDEFQNYRDLLNLHDETDQGILMKTFLQQGNADILMLSATPYRMYTTMNEEYEHPDESHFKEFFAVMDFIFDDGKHPAQIQKFHMAWNHYTYALHEWNNDRGKVLLAAKQEAERQMYKGIARTERISVTRNNDYIDDSKAKAIKIGEEDVQSYRQIRALIERTEEKNIHIPVDYVKSCPYLMSFMQNYDIKEKLFAHYQKTPAECPDSHGSLLWIKRSDISNFRAINPANARLKVLEDEVFQQHSENYLWVPSTLPYYKPQGVYKNSEGFSKILVFSSWEMVPRMIACMISYEAERRTVRPYLESIISSGSRSDDVTGRSLSYYPHGKNNRIIAPRLRFSIKDNVAQGMTLFALLYPSDYLACLYDPVSCYNSHMTLHQIRIEVVSRIHSKIAQLEQYIDSSNPRVDERWYYLVPMLMDGKEYVLHWLSEIRQFKDNSDQEDKGGWRQHLSRLEYEIQNPESLHLGKMPKSLADILTDMAIASPAVCIYRTNGKCAEDATAIAQCFVNLFNTPEAIAIVENAYKSRQDYWQKVLRYCEDGNFQAMFDEYYAMMLENTGTDDENEREHKAASDIINALNLRQAVYRIDTEDSFRHRVMETDDSKAGRYDGIGIRTSFAVSFAKGVSDDQEQAKRRGSVRQAFNSPLRPFVLASTSIGQEGLDFHYYCRKIMHWNLPSNPIELEQREGRINRYKCLAVRENIADQYKNEPLTKNVWNGLYLKAEKDKKNSHDQRSDLIPYWYFEGNNRFHIERIVPMYPMSSDEVRYKKIIEILNLYRLTLGQPRQKELIEYFKKHAQDIDLDELKQKLFIDLSPYDKAHQKR